MKSGKREFFGRLHSCSVIKFSRALCNSQSVLISSLLTSCDVFSLHHVSIKRGVYACFRRLLRVPVTCHHGQRFIILITCPGRFPKFPAKLFQFSRFLCFGFTDVVFTIGISACYGCIIHRYFRRVKRYFRFFRYFHSVLRFAQIRPPCFVHFVHLARSAKLRPGRPL